MKRLIVMLVLIVSSFNVTAQIRNNHAAFVERLKSESMIERTNASREVFGAGLRAPMIYETLAQIINDALPGIDADSPRLNEVAWHVKALGSSGDPQYRDLIVRAMNAGPRSLRRHGKEALEILDEAVAAGRPYLDYTKVVVLTERQAEQCRFITQRNCQTSRSAERCVASHQDHAVHAGANAIVLLHSNSRTVGLGPFGGDTNMLANYYSCE